jgi:hypothetical protein
MGGGGFREAGLAAKLEKVSVRLAADAPGMERPGSDLIAFYLSPGRHPAGRPWSRKHADTQRRLCERYLAPVIGGLACEDIKIAHMQAAVNAAPTAGEGARVRRCVSALVGAGITGGYLASSRLREVHWQPGDRPAPEPVISVAAVRWAGRGSARQFQRAGTGSVERLVQNPGTTLAHPPVGRLPS